MADIEAAKQSASPAVEDLTRSSDAEKTSPRDEGTAPTTRTGRYAQMVRKALTSGQIEERGIEPIPLEERNLTSYFHCFTVWCSINCNILPVTFGLMGPKYYDLSFRDSILIIIFILLLTTLAPAFLATLGPKTGMRQMVQARFSFG